jgi:hypothetical protein
MDRKKFTCPLNSWAADVSDAWTMKAVASAAFASSRIARPHHCRCADEME